jgi:multiple sugar transport system permease protein
MRRAIFYVVLALAAAAFLYPFLWMAATSLMSPGEVGGLSLLPQQPTFENYRLMWSRAPFGRALFNSLFVATTITFSVLVFGSAAAYAMARLSFPGRRFLDIFTVGVLLVPAQLTLIPMYTVIVQLGWVDSYAALIAALSWTRRGSMEWENCASCTRSFGRWPRRRWRRSASSPSWEPGTRYCGPCWS